MEQNTNKVTSLLQNILIANCYSLEELENSKKPVNYLYAANGVFEVRKNEVGLFSIKDRENKEPSLFDFNEHMELNVPKIPEIELYRIKKFFKDVCSHFNNSEAMVQIFWDKKEQKYFTICLEQTVSGGAVHYKRNIELEQDENNLLVMDIHSHDTMGAFFSGTDNRDEKETRLYGVIGKVTSPEMEMKFRYSVAGKFVSLTKEDIFELQEYSLEEVDYPKEWMDKVKPYTYSNVNYGYNYGYSYYDNLYKQSEPLSINKEKFEEKTEETMEVIEKTEIEKNIKENKQEQKITSQNTKENIFVKFKRFIRDLFS